MLFSSFFVVVVCDVVVVGSLALRTRILIQQYPGYSTSSTRFTLLSRQTALAILLYAYTDSISLLPLYCMLYASR